MITSRFHSGLGNQLFQYAMGKRISEQLGVKWQIDLSLQNDPYSGIGYLHRSYALNIFNISPSFHPSTSILDTVHSLNSGTLNRWLRLLASGRRKIIKERHFSVDHSLITSPPDNCIYQGYWQSELYFEAIADDLRKEFTFKNQLLLRSQELFRQICSEQSICLNVRRREFLELSDHNVTDRNYFIRSAHTMLDLNPDAVFYVFSDDIKWCATELNLPFNHVIVGPEHYGLNFGNYLQLMTSCQHFIIPNSSFAWWAAWLGEKEENTIVICPLNWFASDEKDTKDLIPNRWLRQSNLY